MKKIEEIIIRAFDESSFKDYKSHKTFLKARKKELEFKSKITTTLANEFDDLIDTLDIYYGEKERDCVFLFLNLSEIFSNKICLNG